MILPVELRSGRCEIVLERGILARAGSLLRLGRRVMIVTDEGVPPRYVETVASQCEKTAVFSIPCGGGSKSFSVLQQLLERMLDHGLTRDDCVVAVGGGVVGDLAGLAASVYMRGIDFYNIPTTLLSQVDASVGAKNAINFAGAKNIVGTFYQPGKVLIDPDVLNTLPRRQVASGLAESLKMALTLDRTFFEFFESKDPFSSLDHIIQRSLECKIRVVTADEQDKGLRHVLNFGHTIGHAIEATHPELLHGECVALGMIPMCSLPVLTRLLPVYDKLGLPTCCDLDKGKMKQIMAYDKKYDERGILDVEVGELGSFRMKHVTPNYLSGNLYLIARGSEEP